MHDIHLSKFRATLTKSRGEPYWQPRGKGCALGYRVNRTGDHTWIARYRLDGEKQFCKLGREATMTYDEAVKAAEKWFKECENGQKTSYATVEDVCRAYVSNRRIEKGDKTANDASKRFTAYVYGTKLAKLQMRKLRPVDVQGLRDRIMKASSKGNANRYMRCLKAALNYGHHMGMTNSTEAWVKVKPFPSADGKRELYLPPAELRANIDKCYPWLSRFLTGLAWVGCRPGELRNATVADINFSNKTLRLVSYKGAGGVERVRHFPLSNPMALAFFKEQVKGKTPAAPLLSTDRGGFISEGVLSSSVRRARNKRGVHPEFCAYTVRHCTLTNWVVAGIPTAAVAKMAGTSINKINDNYYQFVDQHVEDKLAAVNLL